MNSTLQAAADECAATIAARPKPTLSDLQRAVHQAEMNIERELNALLAMAPTAELDITTSFADVSTIGNFRPIQRLHGVRIRLTL